MTYFEDFYATSAEFPHPTLTSGATPPPLHPSVSLKVLNSPNAPASPPYLPTAVSKQENHSETFTNQNINIWCETKKNNRQSFHHYQLIHIMLKHKNN